MHIITAVKMKWDNKYAWCFAQCKVHFYNGNKREINLLEKREEKKK